MSKTYYVDVPNPEKPGEFITIDSFTTKKEAIALAETYGADSKGNISMISSVDD